MLGEVGATHPQARLTNSPSSAESHGEEKTPVKTASASIKETATLYRQENSTDSSSKNIQSVEEFATLLKAPQSSLYKIETLNLSDVFNEEDTPGHKENQIQNLIEKLPNLKNLCCPSTVGVPAILYLSGIKQLENLKFTQIDVAFYS